MGKVARKIACAVAQIILLAGPPLQPVFEDLQSDLVRKK